MSFPDFRDDIAGKSSLRRSLIESFHERKGRKQLP